MQHIFVGSTGPASGRSLMTWFLAERLLQEGFKVGFVKPASASHLLGMPQEKDSDLDLMRAVLGEEVVSEGFFEGADVTLVMGSPRMFSDFSLSPTSDTDLIKTHQAHLCLMDRYESMATSIYSILSIHSLFKGKLKIVVVNRVPEDSFEAVKAHLVPRLQAHGIPKVAVLAEDPVLASFSVAKIADMVGAEVLEGHEYAGAIVGGLTVGSQALGGPLKVFRQVYGKIVLLTLRQEQRPLLAHADSGDRAAVVGILLTGGRPPSPLLIEIARKGKICLLVTAMDAFAAFERIQAGPSPVTSEDRYKQTRFADLLSPQILDAGPLSAIFDLF